MPNGPPRILIVDDDVNITYAFKLGLERRGFLVDVFNDAAEVLGRTKPNSYQVAIFDFRMPKINGLELYRGFKKLNTETPSASSPLRTKNLSLLILTSKRA